MSNEYRERAAECFRLVSGVNNPQQRALLLEMARAWLRLHDQAEKNAQTEQRALLLEMAIAWLRLHENAQADPTNKTPQPSVPQQHQQQQQRAQPKASDED